MKARTTIVAGYCCFVVMTLFCSAEAVAESAGEKGLNIVREADRRDSGWADSSSHMTMVLTNRRGDERRREIRSRSLEMPDDGDKRLIIFDYPPNMRGTAFLNYSHKRADDDQWIYLPALKRVRRIASRSKSESFVGSEFTYEDIAGEELEKYSYQWLRDEFFDGHLCFVIESYPVDARNSGYSRRVSWIDQHEYYLLKVDYFDRKDSFLKTLFFSGYHQYQSKFWRPDMMEMVNHQNDKNTRMIWKSYQFQTGLDEADFTQRSLKLGR